MEIRERALGGVAREIGAQPVLLVCLVGLSPTRVELAVERHDVPRADIVAVVAFACRSRSTLEVCEVRRAASAVVVVIPGRRSDDVEDLFLPPRRCEAALKIFVCA